MQPSTDTRPSGGRRLRMSGVEDLTGLKKSTLYRLMSERDETGKPGFPLPFCIGRSRLWCEDEVRAWLEALPRKAA